MTLPFHPRFEDLPRILPVFPLSGALLLPRGKLPLNVFEPRYLALVQDSLAWGRMFGMIQPSSPTGTPHDPPIFDVGCAGRVSAFQETDDGRLLITLTGVCRFRVAEEVDGARGYRRIVPDWAAYRDDLDEEPDISVDRPRLFAVLKPYLKQHGMELNWKAIESAGDLALTVSLAMLCPMEPSEKQALLESHDPSGRAELLIALLEMALAGKNRGKGLLRQ